MADNDGGANDGKNSPDDPYDMFEVREDIRIWKSAAPRDIRKAFIAIKNERDVQSVVIEFSKGHKLFNIARGKGTKVYVLRVKDNTGKGREEMIAWNHEHPRMKVLEFPEHYNGEIE